MKLFTKKNKDKNDSDKCDKNIEQQLNDNIFKHKNSFEAQKSKLCDRVSCGFVKKNA